MSSTLPQPGAGALRTVPMGPLGGQSTAASVGPDPLLSANGHQQLGAALMLQGDREGAIRELEEAARVFTLVLGPATNERANSYMIISLAHSRAGDLEAARKTIDHALEIFRLIP